VNYAGRAVEAAAVADAIRGLGRQAAACQADVSAAEQVVALFRTTIEQFGRLDILVNNAGVAIWPEGPVFGNVLAPEPAIDEQALAAWNQMLAVNLSGVFLCSQAAIPYIRTAPAGRIINIASLTVITGGGPAGYAASKAALLGLTRHYAQQLAGSGATANAVVPGMIMTDMTPQFYPGQRERDMALARTPAGRFGQPEDVAEAVAFLASPRAGFITGHALVVDGGRSWSQQGATMEAS
jgi:3-oxoacyl-[acyl-carrier protein] reductase